MLSQGKNKTKRNSTQLYFLILYSKKTLFVSYAFTEFTTQSYFTLLNTFPKGINENFQTRKLSSHVCACLVANIHTAARFTFVIHRMRFSYEVLEFVPGSRFYIPRLVSILRVVFFNFRTEI